MHMIQAAADAKTSD